MTTIPFLVKIGMSEEEQQVYLALLALGPLSAGEIAKYSGVKSIPKVKAILQKLFEMNYAYQIEGLVDKAIGMYPFREIAAEAENDAKKIGQTVAKLKAYVAEQLAHLDQVMSDTEAHVRSEKKQGTDTVTQNSTETRAAVEANVTEATNSVTSTVDSTKKRITSSANSFLRNQTESANTFESTTHESADAFATELKSKTEASLEALSSGIRGKNNKFFSEGSSTLETASETISEKTNTLATTLKDDSREKLDGTRDHLLNGLESFVNESEGNVDTLNGSLSTATNEQGASIRATTEEAMKNRIDLNNQFKEGIADSFEKVKGDIALDLDEFQKKFNTKLAKIANRFKKQIDDLKDATTEDVRLVCEEAGATVNDITVKHNEEIAANVDLDNKAVEDGTLAMLTKIDEQNSASIASIGSAIDTLKSSVTLLKANYSADINSNVDETITLMHTTIEETTQATKDEYETAKTSVIDNLKSLTSGNSRKTATIAETQTEEIKGTTDTLTGDIKNNVSTTKGTMVSETKKAKQKIASSTTSGVESIGTTSTSTLTEVQNLAITNIRSNEETSIGTINNIANVVETSVRKEITATKSGLDDFYKRFAKDALKISKLLRDFRTDHESFQTAVNEHPKPLVETAILYSKAAIFDRLTEILTTRIKSNVTMVIPDPTDIPIKAIAKVKQQAKITIISKIDEVANKNIIDEIRSTDTLGRIKIRKIGMQDMIGYSEYLAFDIDGGEEMLIAFKDETEKDWVGVLSQADGFKNVIIGETLGRQALSISRDLK
ncbi:MAG: helix-turn-helix domain-containing protein [Candidatus Heimdallarchaeota archaeon]